ncbi:four-carbon acid sugar kinase family protein [Anaerolentibacter hominis]|uniref:four-carbon acid sugar kinase family protein n=1 Tax=Anaerolentibacter hominis TaxID=3079009 RepID=UPI0031B82665
MNTRPEQIQIGVVADDVTGANDIAVMYVKGGLSANVFSFDSRESALSHEADVVVIDTDSRFMPARTAYQRVFEATRTLADAGIKRFFKKTCSVFRGNIGAEFDGMLDALGEKFAVVVLGFPDNGRTTVDGVHYVRGTLLEESEFRNDPVNPMTESNLADILRRQTRRGVKAVGWPVIEEGPEALRAEIERQKKEGGYLILDVRDNKDLEIIAEATEHIRVMCGASAIAYPQAKRCQSSRKSRLMPPALKPGLGIMSVSGSLMPQTREQIICAGEQGTLSCALPVRELFEDRETLVERLSSLAAEGVSSGRDVLVYSDNDRQIVEEGKQFAASLGFDEKQMAKCISETLAQICRNVLERTGQNRVLVAGGDTSGSFCSEMKIDGMAVYEEIESGLPSSIALTEPPLFIVLKSGSFGGREFFVKTYRYLREN